MLEGLNVAMCHGWDPIIIESDCKKVVDDLGSELVGMSKLGLLYADIRELKPHFQNCCIAYVSRKGNHAAYKLARWA